MSAALHAVASRKTGRLIACLVFAAALFPARPAAAGGDGTQIKAPVEPAAPAVDVGEKRGPAAETEFPVTVTLAKGEPLTGSLLFAFDTIQADTAEEGPERKKSIPLALIKTIEFTGWRGTLRRKNEYAFYPALMKVTLRDGKAYQCTRLAPNLNRVRFRDYRGKRVLYAFFFDYRDGKKWRNSGEADMRYPETSPAAGTVMRIDFTAAEIKNPLEMLFRQIAPSAP